MTTTESSKIIWWCYLFLIGSFVINHCDCGALEKELEELPDDEENDIEATYIPTTLRIVQTVSFEFGNEK